jgi:hypothetical protein
MTSWQSQQVSAKPTIRPRGAARNTAAAAAGGSSSATSDGAAAANNPLNQYAVVKPELTTQVLPLCYTKYRNSSTFKLGKLAHASYN